MIQIELDPSAIAELEKAVVRAAKRTVDALKTDVASAQVMPFDTGMMQNTDTFVSAAIQNSNGAVVSLVTDSPQARRLYYHPEYNFQTVNNPHAGGLWLEPWISGEYQDFVSDTFAQMLHEEAGV